MRTLYKNEQTGRSMVEMLGVLAIIGILSVGGIAGYSKAMAKFKVSKTLDQISMLVTNIRTMYGNQNSFSGLTNTTATTYGLISKDMETSTAGSLTNPFGGAVIIKAEADPQEFSVSYAGMDQNACMTIATADWGSSVASGLVNMAVSGGTAKTFTWTGTGDAGLPVTVAGAAAACGSSSTIVWTYR